MAASSWGTDRRLDDCLFDSGYEFDFFQAVRLLKQWDHEQQAGVAIRDRETVRFQVKNTLAFPASSIDHIDRDHGGPAKMTVTFLGLTGPEGVLPAAYTEMAVDRECFGDKFFADFLDLFNHRLISLFYRAWEKHHFSVGYEQSKWGFGQDAVTSSLFDLIGMGTEGLQQRLPFCDEALLRYAGLIAQRPHSAEALRSLLQDYFGVPVRIEQFLGKWYELEEDEVCQLGSDEANGELGCGAVAGDAVWTRHALIRIVLGPLTLEQFRDFLPDGECFTKAAALARYLLGSSLDFEMQPTLRGEDVPACQIGVEPSDAPRLGWSTWLRTEPFRDAAIDAVFKEEELVRLEA
ncbi:MAG TPA: type VI secretion system baseplate subunit TssG [Candidatus Sulfotelmatobacter sp.]|nr:type VI secretion system baseplate subunit TssG [Candidatus Sulfotelmatobacter sp.]